VELAVWRRQRVCFFLLFLRARLYGDMALQVLSWPSACSVVPLALWRRGHSRLSVTRISNAMPSRMRRQESRRPQSLLRIFAALETPRRCRCADDGVERRGAVLMTRKVIEHWLVWMAADVIYIWLYAERGLYLTSLLYVVFFVMCVAGWRDWLRDISHQRAAVA
jgi:nicotinamide riboside transporter PnuC